MDRLLPVIDALNKPYWDGAREHRLVLLRCRHCSKWVHPPRPTCPGCLSETLEAAEASGRGKIYSWSVMHSGGNPGFEDRLPYAVVVVELDEQANLITIGNIDCPPDQIEIGMPLEVTYEKINDEITLPQWRPAKVEAAR